MLSLFDTLVASLKNIPPEETGTWVEGVIHDLEEAVRKTTEQLPELKKAGVVDAGALGMLVFLDPLLNTLAGRAVRAIPFHGRAEGLPSIFPPPGRSGNTRAIAWMWCSRSNGKTKR